MDHVAALALARMKHVASFLLVCVAVFACVVITLFLSGCAPRFILGAETPPPAGCVAARERGHDC